MMKKVILCLSLLFMSPFLFAQIDQLYYWYEGEKQPLQLKSSKIYLLLDDQTDKKSLAVNLQVAAKNIERIRKVELGASNKEKNSHSNYCYILKAD